MIRRSLNACVRPSTFPDPPPGVQKEKNTPVVLWIKYSIRQSIYGIPPHRRYLPYCGPLGAARHLSRRAFDVKTKRHGPKQRQNDGVRLEHVQIAKGSDSSPPIGFYWPRRTTAVDFVVEPTRSVAVAGGLAGTRRGSHG
jgi:hypothetical protein